MLWLFPGLSVGSIYDIQGISKSDVSHIGAIYSAVAEKLVFSLLIICQP